MSCTYCFKIAFLLARLARYCNEGELVVEIDAGCRSGCSQNLKIKSGGGARTCGKVGHNNNTHYCTSDVIVGECELRIEDNSLQ